jgi:hypothetical protein
LCALLWVALTGLAQPWFSEHAVLLYTDGALLLVAARYFPVGPALFVTGVGALCADALREGPFGLSATLLLPAALVLVAFRPSLHLKGDGWWLGAVTLVNTLAYAVSALVWTLMQTTRHARQVLPWQDTEWGDVLAGFLAGALASSAFVVLFGFWFAALQRSLFLLWGRDLHDRTPQ